MEDDDDDERRGVWERVCVAGGEAVELEGVHFFSVCTLAYLVKVSESFPRFSQLPEY